MSNIILKPTNHSIANTFNDSNENTWSDPYYFVFGADPQLGIINQQQGSWEQEIELVEKAVAAVNKMQPRPRFFMIGGDLVDAAPSQKGHEQQIEDVKKAFSKLHQDIPLLCLPGNHDIGNAPTAADIDDYRRHFGDDWYSFWCGGVCYIVINSQYYYDGSKVEDLKKAQHEWLENQLIDAQFAKAKHIILFQHIPLCLEDVDEEDNYFVIPKKERLPLLSMLQYHGVSSIFSGHRHGNECVRVDSLDMVTSTSMTFQLHGDKNGVRIVKVDDQSVKHEYYDYDNLPTSI